MRAALSIAALLLALLLPAAAARAGGTVACLGTETSNGPDQAAQINSALATGGYIDFSAGVCWFGQQLNVVSNSYIDGVGELDVTAPDPAHAGQTPVQMIATPSGGPYTKLKALGPGYSGLVVGGPTTGTLAPQSSVYIGHLTVDENGTAASPKGATNVGMGVYIYEGTDVTLQHVEALRAPQAGIYNLGGTRVYFESVSSLYSYGNGVYGIAADSTHPVNFFGIDSSYIAHSSQGVPFGISPLPDGTKLTTFDGFDVDCLGLKVWHNVSVTNSTLIDNDILTMCHASGGNIAYSSNAARLNDIVDDTDLGAGDMNFAGTGCTNTNGYISGFVEIGTLCRNNWNHGVTLQGALSLGVVANETLTMQNATNAIEMVYAADINDPTASNGVGSDIVISNETITQSPNRTGADIYVNGSSNVVVQDIATFPGSTYGFTGAGPGFRTYNNH